MPNLLTIPYFWEVPQSIWQNVSKIPWTSFSPLQGGKASSKKICLYGWNCNPKTLREISMDLRCKVEVDWKYFKYLGVTSSRKNASSMIWTPILQNIKNKVQVWGIRWLGLDGKVTLIKCVLSYSPIFNNVILLAPKNVMNNISVQLRKFLWQGEKSQGNKFHLIN